MIYVYFKWKDNNSLENMRKVKKQRV